MSSLKNRIIEGFFKNKEVVFFISKFERKTISFFYKQFFTSN